MLGHLEGLAESGGADLQFKVFLVAVEVVFDEFAQFHAVFYPYAVGVVDFHNDSVVLADFDIYEEVVFSLKPCFH